jgi:chaperonin GroES
MATQLKVLFNKILVEVGKAEERVGSLFVARLGSEEGPVRGTVVKVGTGWIRDNGEVTPMTVAVGDKVWFNTFDSAILKFEGKEYRVLPEISVLGYETEVEEPIPSLSDIGRELARIGHERALAGSSYESNDTEGN